MSTKPSVNASASKTAVPSNKGNTAGKSAPARAPSGPATPARAPASPAAKPRK